MEISDKLFFGHSRDSEKKSGTLFAHSRDAEEASFASKSERGAERVNSCTFILDIIFDVIIVLFVTILMFKINTLL